MAKPTSNSSLPSPRGLRARLAGLSVETLLWTMGLFCAFVGAFVLVAPHRFTSPPYTSLRPYSAWWGILALLSGFGMLAVAILRPRRWVGLTVHVLVGLALFALAVSFGSSGAWSGMAAYTVLGVGTALAGAIRRGPATAEGGDVFALLMGMVTTLSGILLTAMPELVAASLMETSRLQLLLLGLGFLLTGPFLCRAHLDLPADGRQSWGVHLAAGAACFAYGALASLPLRAWTGIALYWGCGAAVAMLPGLRRGIAALETSALRTRLAFTLATATSLALILATAVVTAQEERLAEIQVRGTQQVEADAIARNVADYVELNGAHAFSVAALAGQAPLRSGAQARLLVRSLRSLPDVTALRTLDREGRVVAAAGPIQMPVQRWHQVAAQMRGAPARHLNLVRVRGQQILLLSTPVRTAEAGLIGVVVAVFDSAALARRIVRSGSSVSLADGYGTLIAHRDDTPAGSTLPELPAGWDRQVRAGRPVERARGVAAFALVPGLEWAVAVERPRALALAGVRRGRDLAFGLLLLVVPLAVVGGILVARRIARPLGTLADAADAMTAGHPAVPLERSDIAEVARLSAAFREMRERLAERTREGELLASELRARAEALAETDRRKDEFLAMLAHELRNPLGAISNASYLLEQRGSRDPQMARPVVIIRRQIQHLVRMVDDLLDVSRITRGKVELRRQPVDLGEVVRHAVESSRSALDAKHHELLLTLTAEPLPLLADATRLEQVLSNLLRNAAKFTEPGGRIELVLGREGKEAVVRMRDNGIGIASSLLPRVFDLFAQGEQALDRSGAGLGIGLTLVQSLVEMHGGRVEALSDGPGLGSEFVVRLPLVPSHQADRHAAAAGE